MKSIHLTRTQNSTIMLLCVLLALICSSCEDNDLTDLLEEEAITEQDNNDNGDNTNDDTVNLVTYQNTAKGILDNACIQCHGATSANGGIRLHTYENAKAVAESGRMIIRMSSASSPMPPSGNLPAPIIQEIMDWIDDGLLEN